MTASLDHLLALVRNGLGAAASIKHIEDGVMVTTHCMYPSNGLVRVAVRGRGSTVVVSDEGAAFGEALAAGVPVRDYDRTLGKMVREQGLILNGSVIYTPPIPLETAPLGVLLTANMSQDIAKWLLDYTKIKRARDIKTMLTKFLELC